MCSSQTHAPFVLWPYTCTVWLFAYRMVLSLKPDILFLIWWRFFIWSCLCWCNLLVQNPLLVDIALLNEVTEIQRRISWKNMRRNVKNVAHPFWILNLWPGGLLWNTDSWIRNRKEMSEKCPLMAWKVIIFDACVLYCCLYPVFISSFHLSKGNTTWCLDIKPVF